MLFALLRALVITILVIVFLLDRPVVSLQSEFERFFAAYAPLVDPMYHEALGKRIRAAQAGMMTWKGLLNWIGSLQDIVLCPDD